MKALDSLSLVESDGTPSAGRMRVTSTSPPTTYTASATPLEVVATAIPRDGVRAEEAGAFPFDARTRSERATTRASLNVTEYDAAPGACASSRAIALVCTPARFALVAPCLAAGRRFVHARCLLTRVVCCLSSTVRCLRWLRA